MVTNAYIRMSAARFRPVDFFLPALRIFACSAIVHSSLYQTGFAETLCNEIGAKHQNQSDYGLEKAQGR